MQDTHRIQETYPQEGIDSKAYLLCFLRRIPYMLLIGLTGAIIGSGLYLLIAAINNRTTVYMQETEYYIDFAPGRIDHHLCRQQEDGQERGLSQAHSL